MTVIRTVPIGRPTDFYISGTTTTAYVVHNFGFDSNTIIISNDSTTEDTQLSWDGIGLDGEIKKGEVLTFSSMRKTKLYEKSASGGQSYRIWAY